MYNYPKRAVAILLLLSHLLTSCWNSPVKKRIDAIEPGTSQQAIDNSTNEEERKDNNMEVENAKSNPYNNLSENQAWKFTGKQGHQIQFLNENLEEAIVSENVGMPFTRELPLRVIKEDSNLKVEDLLEKPSDWYQHHLRVVLPEETFLKQGYVYIGTQYGLLGGTGRKSKSGQSDKFTINNSTPWIINGFDWSKWCLKNEAEHEEAIKAYFKHHGAPIHTIGPKEGKKYTVKEYIALYKDAHCFCSNCYGRNVNAPSVSSNPSSSSFSTPININPSTVVNNYSLGVNGWSSWDIHTALRHMPTPRHMYTFPTAPQTTSNPSVWSQVWSSSAVQSATQSFVRDSLIQGFQSRAYLNRLAEYYKEATEAKLIQMQIEQEELNKKLEESSRQAAIEKNQQALKRQEEAKQERQKKRQIAYERVQKLIDQRVANEQNQNYVSVKLNKTFIASFRQSNVEGIKELFEAVKLSFNEMPTNQPLDEEEQELISSLLTDINQEMKEIVDTFGPIIYTVRSSLNPQGLPILDESLQVGSKLLGELHELKKEVDKILAARGEDISSYEPASNIETPEEVAAYQELEIELNDPSDALEWIADSQEGMQNLLGQLIQDSSKLQQLKPAAIGLSKQVKELLDLLKAKKLANESLYFGANSIGSSTEGAHKIYHLQDAIDTLEELLTYFCDRFEIDWPESESMPIITQETLKEGFNMLLDLLVPGSSLIQKALGTSPLPETAEEWISLALETGWDFLPIAKLGKVLKLLAGPAKSLVHAKMASVLIAQVKKRGQGIIKSVAKFLHRIPTDWIVKASKNKKGTKYINPKNTGDYIRFSPENMDPRAPLGQKVPYFQRYKDGKVLTRSGEWVLPNTVDRYDYHIPQELFEKFLHLLEF